jgi:hypothetical protein
LRLSIAQKGNRCKAIEIKDVFRMLGDFLFGGEVGWVCVFVLVCLFHAPAPKWGGYALKKKLLCMSVTNFRRSFLSNHLSQRLEILVLFVWACHMVGFIFKRV